MKLWVLILFSLFFSAPGITQVSNLQHKRVVTSGKIKIDTAQIIFSSFNIKAIDSSYYRLDEEHAILTWLKDPGIDSAEIIYRTLPSRLQNINANNGLNSLSDHFIIPSINNLQNKKAKVFDFGALESNGTFSRSLSFGNSQGAAVNAQLNLQLSGFIGDSIHLTATINDNNMPLQPDGTTQKLKHLDNISLQFQKKNWQLQMGDIDILETQQHFTRVTRHVQGMAFTTENKKDKMFVAGAIARGQSAINIFQGQEGNQGPYRLTGNDHELFLLMISGSEKVFIDGELLERGADKDYTINYYTGEVLFMVKRLITRDKRIRIEFEYTDQNYLSSFLYGSYQQKVNKNFQYVLSIYNNSDSKNSPLGAPLSKDQKYFLSQLGDSTNKALYPSANMDSFSADKILYKKIDTVVNLKHDSIYIFSRVASFPLYNLAFTYTGEHNGNYIESAEAVNGKVYKWVSPVNNIPQGNFEPGLFLAAPKKHELVSISFEQKIGRDIVVTGDIAASNFNANSFSNKDHGDDGGYAGKIFVQRNSSGYLRKQAYKLTQYFSCEKTSKQFHTIESFRPVEFFREWGLDLKTSLTGEQLISSGISIQSKTGEYQYSFANYLRDDYRGYRNEITFRQSLQSWDFNGHIQLAGFSFQKKNGVYLFPQANFSRYFKKMDIKIGGEFTSEKMLVKNEQSEIENNSYGYRQSAAFIKIKESQLNNWSLRFFTRTSQLPMQGKLAANNVSYNYELSGQWLKNKHHQLRIQAAYRQSYFSKGRISENTLAAKIAYSFSIAKESIKGGVVFETGSGQEQKKQVLFIEVPAGKGQYTWIDYNADNIKQLNEFEIAVFTDQAKFIKVFTTTNEFIKAKFGRFEYSVNIIPCNILKNQFWKQLSYQSSLETYLKQTGKSYFKMLPGQVADTALIAASFSLRNNLTFTNKNNKWSVAITNSRAMNKALLLYGLETNSITDWFCRSRFSLQKFDIELFNQYKQSSISSTSFQNHNYAIASAELSPRIIFNYQTTGRLQALYSFSDKKNKWGDEKALSHEVSLSADYSVRNFLFKTGISSRKIFFTGDPNTAVSYNLLTGLRPGVNYTWNMQLSKNILHNMELQLSYDGRKPGGSKTIHTGQVAVRVIL